mgnify:CR=1 FL=1
MPEFLPDLPVDGIMECLKRSPGHEVRTGKFDGPESSASLVANAFGWFLNRAQVLPPLPSVPAGQVTSVTLEAEMRFPWAEGRHPWLDVAIEPHTTLIGIESRRYEPFRPMKANGFAEIYDRPVWREKLGRFTQKCRRHHGGKERREVREKAGHRRPGAPDTRPPRTVSQQRWPQGNEKQGGQQRPAPVDVGVGQRPFTGRKQGRPGDAKDDLGH